MPVVFYEITGFFLVAMRSFLNHFYWSMDLINVLQLNLLSFSV